MLLCTGMTKFCCALVIDLPRRICEQKAKRGTFRFQGQATYCLEFTALLYYYPCVMIKSGAWFGNACCVADSRESIEGPRVPAAWRRRIAGTHRRGARRGGHNIARVALGRPGPRPR